MHLQNTEVCVMSDKTASKYALLVIRKLMEYLFLQKGGIGYV